MKFDLMALAYTIATLLLHGVSGSRGVPLPDHAVMTNNGLSASLSREHLEERLNECPILAGVPRLDSLSLTDLIRLDRFCGSHGNAMSKLILEYHSLILHSDHLFPDPSQIISLIPWQDPGSLGRTLNELLLESVVRYVEQQCTFRVHWQLSIVLRYIGSTGYYSIIEHVRKAQDYRGDAFAAALESCLLSSTDGVQLVARAVGRVPGFESLLLTYGPDWNQATACRGSISDAVTFLASVLPTAPEIVDDFKKFHLIQNLYKAVRGPTASWIPQDVEDAVFEYSLHEIELILLNIQTPHLKDVVLLGKEVFDVREFIHTSVNDDGITPKLIRKRLGWMLQETGWKGQLLRVALFLDNPNLGGARGDYAWETFAACLRSLEWPLTDLRGWRQLETLMLAHGLIGLNLEEQLQALLSVVFKQQECSDPNGELAAALISKGYGYQQLMEVLGAWRQVVDANMVAIYLQPNLFDPLYIVRALKKDPFQATTLFQASLCQAMKKLPLANRLQVIICERPAHNSRARNNLLLRLYQHMGRPIDVEAGEREAALIEKIIVSHQLGEGVLDLKRVILEEFDANCDCGACFNDVDASQMSTIAEYRKALTL